MTSFPKLASQIRHEYFGTTDIGEMYRIADERRSSDPNDYGTSELSDELCDTSLFPYQTQDPVETPIPTALEICQANPFARKTDLWGARWCVGPYAVKVYAGMRSIFRVCTMPLYNFYDSLPLLIRAIGSREYTVSRKTLNCASPKAVCGFLMRNHRGQSISAIRGRS